MRVVLAALMAIALASSPARAVDPVMKRPGGAGGYVPYGNPPAPAEDGSFWESGTDHGAPAMLWAKPPVTGVRDSLNATISGDPTCRTLRFLELLELSTPASKQCGVNVANYSPTFSALHARSLGIVTTDGDQTIAGAKDFTGTFKRSGEAVSTGVTIGPFTLTGYTHNSGRKYWILTGGAAVAVANTDSYAPVACPKLRRFNVSALDSGGAPRTMPSGNTMTFGLVINGTDLGTAQTVIASDSKATGTPALTTGWAENDRVAVWGQGTGTDTTASLQYRLWISCY